MFHTVICPILAEKFYTRVNGKKIGPIQTVCIFIAHLLSRNLLVHNAFSVTKDFYHQVKSLKNKKGKTILNGFIEIVNKSKHKQSKFWVDQG